MAKDRRMDKITLPPIPRVLDPPTRVTEKILDIPKDNVRLIPEIDILKQERMKYDVEKRLMKKREHTKEDYKNLEKQWKRLEDKELGLQRLIVSHNKFLKRNLEKRERALLKIQNDLDLSKKRDRDIKILDQKYDSYNSVLIVMRNEINKHRMYENYLNLVLEFPDCPFKTLHDILANFEALDMVKGICTKRQNQEMENNIAMHDTNVHFFRNQDYTIVGLKNELTILSQRYEEATRKTIMWEMVITKIRDRCSVLSYQIDTVFYLIDAMYHYICRRTKQKAEIFDSKDIRPKIEMIKHTLFRLGEVIQKNTKKTAKPKKTR